MTTQPPAALATWPGTHIVKSLHTPFNWRRADMDPRPLNADIKATAKPRNPGGRTGPISFGHPGGTMPHLTKALSPMAAKLLADRPAHVAFVIPKASAASRAARA